MNEFKEIYQLQKILLSFSCQQGKDTEFFLHHRAIDFEKLSKCRTYLVCNQEQLENPHSINDSIIIYGYISLAIKVLTVHENTSNRMRKELDGFSSKLYGQPINDFPCYLIGQLSRNSNVPKSTLKGQDLINFAYDVITSSVDAVGGRYIMLECHNKEKLIQFYENNQFRQISRIPDVNQPMIQMIRKI